MTNRNYSSIDGKDLLDKNNKFKISKMENRKCNVCETENNKSSRYCKNCGSNLEEIIELDNNKKINLISKGEITTGVLAVGILFIIGFIFKLVTGIDLNILQIIIAMNLGTVDISSNIFTGNGAITIQLGLLALLIAPIISLVISNLLILKNKDKNSILHNINGVGITYGILLVIISILAPSRFISRNLMQYGISINFSYNIIRLFVNGYIISALCTYLIVFKKKYEKDNMSLIIANKAIKVILIGLIALFAIITLVTVLDGDYLADMGLYKYIGELNLVSILIQLSSYLWSFANFIPTTIGDIVLSPFNIVSSNLLIETKLIFYSIIALSLLIILITGYSLRERYSKNDIKPVIMFSLYYSIFMGIVSLFSKVYIYGNVSLLGIENYNNVIYMGASVIVSIIISYIYSFIVSLIGYKLNNLDR